MTNEGLKQPLQKYAVSVDYPESITVFDFIPEFANSIQNILESRIEYLCGLDNIFLG